MTNSTISTATAVLALSLLSPIARADDACEFLPVEKVNALMAAYQPWRVTQGGVGHCQFEAEVRTQEGRSVTITPVTLSVMQQFQGSAKEATAFVKMVRTEMAKQSSAVDALAARGTGAESFMYPMAAGTAHMVQGYGHANKAVTSVTFHSPGQGVSAEADSAMFIDLLKAAVQSSAQPGIAEKSAQCPAFDAALLKALMPGSPVKVQQFGTESCLASNTSGAALMLQKVKAQDFTSLNQIAESMQKDGCQHDKLPQLGDQASLAYACPNGNPRASVSYVAGLTYFTFSLTPGKEPTAKQRADLVLLAKRNYDLPN